MGTFDPLQIRKKLDREDWASPAVFGPDGWSFIALAPNKGHVIVSAADYDGLKFIHASICRPEMPTYEDLDLLHKAVFPGFAYQVFAPVSSHINICETALHLWGRADGKPWGIPDFGKWGSI